MKNKISLLLLFSLLVVTVLQAQNEEQKILDKLDTQTKCWNNGDLKCFMETYWKSDSLLFVGKEGLTSGWENILNNYRESYPDRLAMGKLRFDILRIQPITKNSYFVVGKWFLSRAMGDLEGHFSLVWEKIDGEWLIISDHSS